MQKDARHVCVCVCIRKLNDYYTHTDTQFTFVFHLYSIAYGPVPVHTCRLYFITNASSSICLPVQRSYNNRRKSGICVETTFDSHP